MSAEIHAIPSPFQMTPTETFIATAEEITHLLAELRLVRHEHQEAPYTSGAHDFKEYG